MKINITKENLLYGVQTVFRAVSAKSPLPVLSGIKFQAVNNSLILIATDLEIGIGCTVPATTIEEGSVVIPAKYISEIAKKLPDESIELIAEGNTVAINYGKSEAKINTFSAEEFPALPPVQSDIKLTLPVVELREMIKQVAIATGDDDSRPVFTGVLLETKEDTLTMVATDTHRLARRIFKLENTLPETKVIIPGRALNELGRLLGDNDFVTLVVGENQLSFALSDSVMISRIIEGQFPQYEGVVPKEHKVRVKIRVKDLLDATERAALLTKNDSSNQVLKYTIFKGLTPMISVSANTKVGKINEEIPVLEHEGEEITIAFNADYITAALKTIGTEEAYLEMSNPLSPGLVKQVDTDNYLYLALPVRTA